MTISVPTCDSIGDVYKLKWDAEHITAQVDHLAESHDTVTGEFRFSLNGDKGGHLYMGKLNMLSAGAKDKFAKELGKRLELDWDTVLEQACVKVIESYRKGEPCTQVGDLPQREKPRYRLYPWVLEDNITTIYGMGGGGKSKLATFIAAVVQTGEEVIGFKPIKGNVLILDWEACQEDWDEYIKAVKVGMCIESTELPYYKRCYRTLANDIIEIQNIVLEKNIKLVIIDSVGMASELTDQFHSAAIGFLRAARSLKCSILLIDHENKDGKQFGSVYKQNEVRSAFELKSSKEAGSKVLDMSIFHTKVNNGVLMKPIGFRISFEGTEELTEMMILERTNICDMPELSGNLPLKERILNVLKRGAMKVPSLTEELGMEEKDQDYVRTVLNRYKNKSFKKLDDGTWGNLLNE